MIKNLWNKFIKVPIITSIIWNKIKNVTIVISIIVNIVALVFFIILLTNILAINIDEKCVATTTVDIPMKMPIAFAMNNGMNINGDADVTIPKDTEFPMKIKMNISLDIKKIMDKKQTVSISIE